MLYFGVWSWKIMKIFDRPKILFWPEIGHFLAKKKAFFFKIPNFLRRIWWWVWFFAKIMRNALIWPKTLKIDDRKITIFRHFWQKYGFWLDFRKNPHRPSNSTQKMGYFKKKSFSFRPILSHFQIKQSLTPKISWSWRVRNFVLKMS